MAVAFITHPHCLLHQMGDDHPEQPARLTAIEDALHERGLHDLLLHREAPRATVEQLARVHPACAHRGLGGAITRHRVGARRSGYLDVPGDLRGGAACCRRQRACDGPRAEPARSNAHSATCVRRDITPNAPMPWGSAFSTTSPSPLATRLNTTTWRAWRFSTSTCTSAMARKTSSRVTSACCSARRSSTRFTRT